MNSAKIKALLFVLLIIGFLPDSIAQRADKVTRIGFSLNGFAYLGDLNEPGVGIVRVSAGGEISIEAVKPRPLGVSFHGGFGQFTEQWDNPDGQPGTRFVQTPFLHGDFRVHARAFQTKAFQPYLSVGAGILSFTPKDVDGFPLEEGNYNTMIPQLPGSAGLRWQVNPMIGFDLSYTWRFTPTDFLDNIGSEGSRSGFDALHAVNLGISFDLGSGLPNEELSRPSVVDTTGTSMPSPENQTISETEATEDGAATIYEEDYDRAAALNSIEDDVFLYYQSKSGETLEELAKRFRVPPDILRDINILQEGTELKKGTYLKIPHVQ